MRKLRYRSRISLDAFRFMRNRGIAKESHYQKSTLNTRVCRHKAGIPLTFFENYHLLQQEDERHLKVAVALIGPISVSIKVTENFFIYQSGVFYDTWCRDENVSVNHAVLLVGYGTDPTWGQYWIIQNSWGKHWGENGFARMGRNTLVNCGIASAPIFPVVNSH